MHGLEDLIGESLPSQNVTPIWVDEATYPRGSLRRRVSLQYRSSYALLSCLWMDAKGDRR